MTVAGVAAVGAELLDPYTAEFSIDWRDIPRDEMVDIVVGAGAAQALAGGLPTAEHTLSVNVNPLPGDVDNSGLVDASDIELFCQHLRDGGEFTPIFDLNQDGAVNFDDFRWLIYDGLGSRLGDANLDGVFDGSDLVQVFIEGLYETDQPATWASGDVNCDGRFTSADFVLTFQNEVFDPPGEAVAADVAAAIAASAHEDDSKASALRNSGR